jgi:lipid-binding SYLF domain-containing protein
MSRLLVVLMVVAVTLSASRAPAADPNETVAQSTQVLAELLAIPGKQIPTKMLSDAQGIAVIPRVIKIGLVAGARRGYGVVLVRDATGAWSLPRFVRLTGGSVGWQAGVQGTDVVLVFATRRSIENLVKGKFTIGVDAAAAAGPVGRNAAAATDPRLQAEILSYSRSRGLFLGASLDGSAIELDQGANAAFYGSPDVERPQIVPQAAMQLQNYVTELSGGSQTSPAQPALAGAPVAITSAAAPPSAVRMDALRLSLNAQWAQLAPLLGPQWQAFLALPADAVNPAAPPQLPPLADAYMRYERVAADPQYGALAARPEFQSMMDLIREYITVVGASKPPIDLPAPPPTLAPTGIPAGAAPAAIVPAATVPAGTFPPVDAAGSRR